MKPVVIDLGCGRKKLPGAFGVDLAPGPGVDLVADLGQGIPLAPDLADHIRLSHIVEHIPDLAAFMAEIHRICKPGATVHIITPHFSAAASYRDPTHAHHLALRSFDHFCGGAGERGVAVRPKFKMKRQRLIFGRKAKLGIEAWANRHAGLYEQHLAFILPALEVEIILEALK